MSTPQLLPRLATLVLLLACLRPAVACDDDLPDPAAIPIDQPTFQVTRSEGGTMLTVLGAFRNTSEAKAHNLVVEATLTDAQGKVIDVLTQPVYGVTVPPGKAVAFRVQGQAAAAPGAYAAVRARVTSGETCLARPAPARPAPKSPWVDLLVSWGPMMLLILVWVLAMRRFSGKGSIQAKVLDAMNQQNALLARQSVALETLAAAAGVPPHGEA